MLKKRLIGVVTVKEGWAIQSFGYQRYLPLGKPEVLIQNLDRWGADEILLQCIDRSAQSLGPDFETLNKINRLGIATPLIYSGGIRSREDAVKVVRHGADRIMVDAMLIDSPLALEAVARDLGTQAVIGHLPVRMDGDLLKFLDYRNKTEHTITNWLKDWPMEWVSELMVTDWVHEGHPNSFDQRLLSITTHIDKPLLCFGGISQPQQIQWLLTHPKVVATGVGNFLNYREHALQMLKLGLGNQSIRMPHFEITNRDT